MSFRLLHGDALAMLKTLPSASVHAVVTDPPAGIAFMGKAWDSDKGGRDHWIRWMAEIAAECLRVAKPGAHALVWALPRTSHWTATAWEDAGWSVRERVSHIFGSGFPKSLDVSKAIDKAAGEKGSFGEPKSVAHAGWINRGRMRGADGHEGYQRPWMQDSEAIDNNARLYLPATDAAKQWQGWGTALKPAMEDWWLLRKPLSEKTVAANVLKHGTGAVNVDACRVETTDALTGSGSPPLKYGGANSRPFHESAVARGCNQSPLGRFPANLIHDGSDEVLEEFAKFGERPGAVSNGRKGVDGACFGHYGAMRSDTGTAARFFYCSKASKRDRGEGNTHPTVKPTELMQYLCRLITPPDGLILDPFSGSGTTGKAALREGFSFVGIEQEAKHVEGSRERIIGDAPLFNVPADLSGGM